MRNAYVPIRIGTIPITPTIMIAMRSPPTFRELAESGEGPGDYDPHQLWLIPIHLRSRQEYYREVEASITADVDAHWRDTGHLHGSREDFDASHFVEYLWSSRSPFWWGLHDIVGYIDVRMDVLEWEFQVSLFLPTKRVSRTLKDKTYVNECTERVSLPTGQPNSVAQQALVEALGRVAAHKSLSKRSLDLVPWIRNIRHTDLIGIFTDFAEALKAR